jgi:hypothetical protein
MARQKGKRGKDLESSLKSVGISFYFDATLSTIRTTMDNRSSSLIFVLELPSKEHHSAYSRDDLWVVGNSSDFNISFLGKSTFFGPSSNMKIDVRY